MKRDRVALRAPFAVWGNDRHSGPTFADMDGDGDLDLFVGGLYGDPSKIYENIGIDRCMFEDVTDNSPALVNMTVDPVDPDLARAVHTLSAGFGDYDLDGDLDMYLTHWGTLDTIYGGTIGPSNPSPMETHHLWRNDFVESGVLRFLNVSETSGISDHTWLTRAYPGSNQITDYSFTPTFARLDGDLWPDIAITGDFQTSQIYLNNGDRATFSNLDNVSLQNAQYGMGSALGDVDNDGDLDWFVTSIFASAAEGADSPLNGNRFYTNLLDAGDPDLFADETDQAGVDAGGWGWGACFLDIDNDSDLDIYHTNGWPAKGFEGISIWDNDRSRVFVRNGGGTFDEAGASLGLDDNLSGRGVVCADFDHDGDVDILQLTDAASNSARLWENRSAAAGNNYLRIELEGLSPNTQAAGARIFVSIDAVGPEQMREIMIGSNYTAQNPTVQIFGLAAATRVNQIRVEWPALYDSGLGMALQPPPTIIDEATDIRLDATLPGDTLTIRHPDLP